MSTALVTGASAGLGAEFARQLASRGPDLVLGARSKERLEELATDLRATYGVRADVLVADLSVERDLARVARRVGDARTPIDVLVNNAGFGLPLHFADNDVADETRHLPGRRGDHAPDARRAGRDARS